MLADGISLAWPRKFKLCNVNFSTKNECIYASPAFELPIDPSEPLPSAVPTGHGNGQGIADVAMACESSSRAVLFGTPRRPKRGSVHRANAQPMPNMPR